MDFVNKRGEDRPRIAFAGGPLMLGCGEGNGLFLQNIGDEPYPHDGTGIHLNPHFTFLPPASVELQRGPNGSVDGMFFNAAEPQDFLDPDLKEAISVGLCAELNAALAADPELCAHVERRCAEAESERTRRLFDKAAESLARAGRDFIEASARLKGPEAGERTPDRNGPAYFVVAAVPEGKPGACGHDVLTAFAAFSESLLGGSQAGAVPVVLTQAKG